jgi:hypothetical protein
MKNPTSNIQHPEKFQEPNSKELWIGAGASELGIWEFSGCWMLEFGAFPL